MKDDKPKRFEALQALALRREERQAIQVERSKQRAQTLGAVLRSLATITVYFIALVMALGEFNVNLGPLIAGAGIVGVALGFGAQSLVKDFLSGIVMLVEDQYGVGDVVDLGDAAGKVEAVNLRTTQVRDGHGTLWHVPNGEVRRVGNKSQQWARAVLDVDVAYDTDINHAMNVIKRVADGLWEDALPDATVLEEPKVYRGAELRAGRSDAQGRHEGRARRAVRRRARAQGQAQVRARRRRDRNTLPPADCLDGTAWRPRNPRPLQRRRSRRRWTSSRP